MPPVYCQISDILERLPEADLAQLTNDVDGSSVDEAKAEAAILKADETINGYLRGIITLPLAQVPEILRHAGVALSIYNLYSRRMLSSGDGLPPVVTQERAAAIQDLERIQRGVIVLDLGEGSDTPSVSQGLYLTDKTEDDLTFSSDTLSKF
jgi:phage gp36-like protein